MLFWTIAVLMAAIVAAPLAFALLRRRSQQAAASDMAIYRDQLADIERDLARGILEPREAERLRTEISRRLLDAGRKARAAGQDSARASPLLAGAVALTLVAGSLALYRMIGAPGYPDLPLHQRLAEAEELRKNRISQAEAEARLPVSVPAPGAAPEHLELLERLRKALESRPDDLQGHVLLARNEAAIGNFVAAARAQERVLAIMGDSAGAEDWADLADILVLAAGGYVSPEAESAIGRALELDPRNGVARYYLGLMLAQTGRPDLAFRTWQALLEDSAPDAPWVAPVRARIEPLAREAGIRYSLPPLPGAGAPMRGPSQADIAAAQDMSAEERRAMIRSMVEGLAERLATEGGPASDWARLITALGVLGETERAAGIWSEAQQVFAASPEALARLRQAAEGAGLTP